MLLEEIFHKTGGNLEVMDWLMQPFDAKIAIAVILALAAVIILFLLLRK